MYKSGTLNNKYYQNGKWQRLEIEEAIEIYKEKIRSIENDLI